MSAANSVENARTSYEQAKETYERNKMELENNMDSSVISSNQKVASAKQALDDANQDYADNEAKIRGYDKGLANAESIYGEDSSEAANAQKELESAEEKVIPYKKQLTTHRLIMTMPLMTCLCHITQAMLISIPTTKICSRNTPHTSRHRQATRLP